MFLESTWGRISAGIILILMTVNGFFIARLVTSLDDDGTKLELHGERLVRLETKIDAIDKKLDAIRIDKQTYHIPKCRKSIFAEVR